MAYITLTLGELFEINWDMACEVLGLNPWCINEGADERTTYDLTLDQARKIGVFKCGVENV